MDIEKQAIFLRRGINFIAITLLGNADESLREEGKENDVWKKEKMD